MLTFLHAADFHLDSPFHALPPEQAAERRQEQRQLLTRLTGPLGNGAIGERRATVRDLRIVRKLGSVRGCGTP